MESIDREGLKQELRAMVAGRGDGIDLDSPERWVISELKEPASFFRHLDKLIPAGSILYFEGCSVLPEVARFYGANRAGNAVFVARDMIFPVPETFHSVTTSEAITGLISLLGQHPLAGCFNHVKAYGDDKIIFAFHDAFDGSDCLVSDQVPEERLRAFCSAVNATYRREPNINKRDPEQLRRFLWALENPDKLRMNWPWWKKAIYFWRR